MIKGNVDRILSQIDEAAQRSGRDASSVTLVCASKYADSDKIRQACDAGIKIFGENKVQSARQKHDQLKDLEIEWHLIGHLQTNKAKQAVELFSLIHSVDSLRLAEELNKQAQKLSKVQDILIEVNTTDEPQKYGIKPAAALELVKSVSLLKNINLKGLMTMGEFTGNPEENRVYFKKLKELFEEVNSYLSTINYRLLTILSMGMTDDFGVAIEEGSMMVRIGRAIWGQ